MKLVTLHRILVSTTIVFCGWFVWQQIVAWKAHGSVRSLGVAAASALVAVALAWYLLHLKRFVRVEPPAGRGGEPRRR